jgi:tRNA (adenine37-N6)-methyltransferase
MDLCIAPIGYVRGGRVAAIDDNWGGERACIELVDGYEPDALFGLSDFSHAEIIFYFDKVPDAKIEIGSRHPRSNKDWPLVGIFAQRGKNRPNRLGLCTCKVIGVSGSVLAVEGLDAIDGTPVLDIKPVMAEFLPRGQVRQPAWSSELMKDYW